jgi:hypothetical protein
MSGGIPFHNILNEKLYNKIGFTSQPVKAFYINEEKEKIEMSLEPIEGQENLYQIVDPKVNWDPEIHNLELKQIFEIQNPGFLFGNGGLVDPESILGIAVRWYSKESQQYYVYPVGEIANFDNQVKEYKIDINIPKGTLRGKVTFELVLYLKYLSSHTTNIVPGTILGVLENIQILFDGESSIFPIVETNDPSKPLWWVVCNFDDPLSDPFGDENIKIVINSGHRHYKNIKIEKGIGSSPLLVEILASALQLIIEKVKSTGEWEQILRNESEPGSIGEAVYYFINTFGWDYSTPESLARSIREDFDQRFK